MEVSVIVPAHNAASTLSETLESLLTQLFTRWEAIVVDDGSSDETANVAARFAGRDARIRFISQPHGGESEARNAGVRLASFDWILFLDADDWLLPAHLERLTSTLEFDESLDAAICGWTRIAPDNRLSTEKHCLRADNIFELSTRCCPFAIHACVVRRSLVESVGGFDATLRTCPDWDLWQRVARMGARFVTIPDVLARYRMRSDSAGVNGTQIFSDALRVIKRGHLPDPRVPHPAAAHAYGVSAEFQSTANFHFACWAAGLVIGSGEDARFLLDVLGDERAVELDPNQVAWMIFESVLLPTCRIPADWVDIWPIHELGIDLFLKELETQSQAPGIARRSRNHLERLVIEHATTPRPLTVGRTHGVRIEITEPLPDILAQTPAERLLCDVEIESKKLGTLELPICNGLVPAYVLEDAIAAEFAWSILGSFFERTLYQQLEIKRESSGVSVWKADLCLANGLSEEEETFWERAHNRIGWAVFVQELWRLPSSPSLRVDNSKTIQTSAPQRKATDNWFIAEISDDLPDVEVAGSELYFVPTVGGNALGVITIPVTQNLVTAEQLRVAVLEESGFELCRAAVREGVLGQPLLESPALLRERLKIAAAQLTKLGTGVSMSENNECSGVCLEPGINGVLRRALAPNETSILFAARVSEVIGTSASRRAMLPAEATPELLEAAGVTSEGVARLPENVGQPDRVVYAPDLVRFLPPHKHLLPRAITGRGDKPDRSTSFHRLLSKLREHPPEIHPDERVFTERLPILMYHSIAPCGVVAPMRYRVTPEAFEEQLRFLHDAGYYSISLEEWRIAMRNEHPLPGRAVLLTFDDGYLDFLTYAWPLLHNYGFTGVVFLVTDEIGRTNRWDRERAEEVALLGWKQIRYLRNEGVEFGSHSASHRPLSALSPVEIVREGVRSRATFVRELGQPARAFAYPHGADDGIVHHLIGACGYVFGATCRFGLSGFYDSLMALPRLEVTGTDSLPEFVKKLSGAEV